MRWDQGAPRAPPSALVDAPSHCPRRACNIAEARRCTAFAQGGRGEPMGRGLVASAAACWVVQPRTMNVAWSIHDLEILERMTMHDIGRHGQRPCGCCGNTKSRRPRGSSRDGRICTMSTRLQDCTLRHLPAVVRSVCSTRGRKA